MHILLWKAIVGRWTVYYMGIRIIRHTSPEKAIYLAKTGEFILKFKNPQNPDHGFNGFIKSRLSEYNARQDFSDVGAVMEFEWSGEIVEIPSDSTSPLPNNILINQPGWRAHIRGLSDERSLKLINIFFVDRKDICRLVDYPFWLDWMPFGGEIIKRQIKLKFIKEFRSAYRRSDCFVSFVIDDSSL